MAVASSVLRLLSDAVVQLCDDVRIESSEAGWDVKAVSHDRVCMVRAHIAAAMFTGYAATGTFVTDAGRLHDVLRHVGPSVTVRLLEGHAEFESDRLVQDVPLGVPDEAAPRFPDLPFTARVMMDLGPFRRLLKAAGDGAEYVTVKVGTEGFAASATGRRGVTASVTVPAEDCVECVGAGKASYPASYVRGIAGVLPKDAAVELALSDDFPVSVTFGSDADVSVRWLVAPRIEEE